VQQPPASVWTREERQAKPPALDRAQIVREAMTLLDAEGLDALSMRRLAGRLKSGATSIYWHVANKDELLELVLDEVFGEIGIPVTEPLRWRDLVHRFAYSMRDTLLRHAWAIPLVGTRPAIGPNALRIMSQLSRSFENAGFQQTNIDYAAAAVLSYVLGSVTSDAATNAVVARAGGDAAIIHSTHRDLLAKAAADYPDLLERYDSYDPADYAVARTLAFDFGLTSMLDGLEVRLSRQEPALRQSTPKRRGQTSS
jgi:AcrR family transcriptional regulator